MAAQTLLGEAGFATALGPHRPSNLIDRSGQGTQHEEYSKMATTFSGTARSERHFTALLLPHLLMADNFAGCRALFEDLGLSEGKAIEPGDVEIVAELNPVRDVGEPAMDSGPASGWERSQVVPDLFIRMGDSALVIEAKFFTHPAASTVADQLRSQREAIDRVLPNTGYERCSFHYLALTVLPLTESADWDEQASQRTWSDVISLLEPVVSADAAPETAYALKKLKEAVERSRAEAGPSPRERGRCESIKALLQHAKDLLENGNKYIGFYGGERALADATVRDMERRPHYKYSDCKPNRNWIPLHSVVSHYLKLKADEHQTTDEEGPL